MPSTPRPLSPVAEEFLAWAADDYVEAFLLQTIVKRLNGPLSAEEERRIALEAVGELLTTGLISVGEMRSDVEGLALLDGTPDEPLGRVAAAWTAQPPPEMGHAPWFVARREDPARTDNAPDS